ncbi:hypothetical protein [Planomonospora venezuelensis]|uniref:Uncharacterized protein n=1 Tax=Planomonospora venezuelensis TaxID=1999 RepID=A0A841CRY7_PLAVE|nr:hypothetical protein [Planomonospora venezuelensis]MBB5961212.1 hypothetical protein [Planomonospora venezuelensis]GIM99885.1 hypothetical protein Pve01_15440 [Planomonospora venezuelensis]
MVSGPPVRPGHRRYPPIPPARGPLVWVGRIIRWRIEIIATAGGLSLLSLLPDRPAWIPVYLLPLVAAIGCPQARRAAGGQFRGLAVRHRFQGLCLKSPLRTPRGWLPLVLGTVPHRDGRTEMYLWCRTGMSLELFVDHIPEIRVACFAPVVTVRPHDRWGHVLVVELRR